jgi:hypothetical protein
MRTFELHREDGKPPALRHIAFGGLFMELTATLIAAIVAGLSYGFFHSATYLTHFAVFIAVGLTICGAAMIRRGISLRPLWDRSDMSASKLTNFHHLFVLIGGGLLLGFRNKAISFALPIFIIESAFLLVYANFVLLSAALKIKIDGSTWAAILLLTAAWYSTFEQVT